MCWLRKRTTKGKSRAISIQDRSDLNAEGVPLQERDVDKDTWTARFRPLWCYETRGKRVISRSQ
jgi:hypothetical protein